VREKAGWAPTGELHSPLLGAASCADLVGGGEREGRE